MSKLTFELKRKAVHIFGLLYVLYYWLALKYLDSHQIGILILLTFIVFFIAVDYFRIIKNKRIPIVQFLWRKKEKDVLGGQVYYVLGITIALAFFEFQIALAVILMTVLGDTAAAIFGIAFGKHWIKKLKDTAWEGIIAEFVVDLIIGYLIIGNWYIIIPMALVATFVETVFTHIDDNLSISLFAGFTGQVIKLFIK